uniref:Prolamin-like domain-containing protein n=1 Tax=Populus trichocarpa TaxID=3694 RepID=A0A2K2AT09_POPTR
MGSFGKNISSTLILFIGILMIITPGFAIRTNEENPELSQHLEECHTKVTKRCAIEIFDSIYTDNTCRTLAGPKLSNNNTPSEYCCQKHITTGKACHDDFIKLFISKVPKEKVTFVAAKGDQIWNHCAAIEALAPAALTFPILP